MSVEPQVYEYCHRWNIREGQPGKRLAEGQARSRWQQGLEFTVICPPRPGSKFPVLVTFVWKKDFACTDFLDDFGRNSANYSFKKINGTYLFQESTWTWEYPDDRRELRKNDAVRIRSFITKPDGYMTETVVDKITREKTKVEYSDVPVHSSWEPIPEFGDWESIARYDRTDRT